MNKPTAPRCCLLSSVYVSVCHFDCPCEWSRVREKGCRSSHEKQRPDEVLGRWEKQKQVQAKCRATSAWVDLIETIDCRPVIIICLFLEQER